MIFRSDQKLISAIMLIVTLFAGTAICQDAIDKKLSAEQAYFEQHGFDADWIAGRVKARKAALDFLSQKSKSSFLYQNNNVELREIRNGRFIFNLAHTDDAIVSANADFTRDSGYFQATGSGYTIGMWDAGMPRDTHQELAGRVYTSDGSSIHYHSTMVAGVIASAGIDSRAKGLLPEVMLNCFDWTDDDIEMGDYAMTTPGQADKVATSNHSYGVVNGWIYQNGIWYWSGVPGQDECAYFGNYYYSYPFDVVCYNSPYYLPIFAAGNDRGDNAPADGITYYEYGDFNHETPQIYFAATGPKSDNWDNGGFDTVDTFACAKNSITVGSVQDAVDNIGGVLYRNVSKAYMTTNSAWGPTDDGRIKPDVVANGYSVYSCSNTSDTSYSHISGTSLAAPGVTGVVGQLIDLYAKLFAGDYMLSSTLKGLIIHTADDLGNAGPDYKFGWGLVNSRAAADILVLHKNNPASLNLIVDSLRRRTRPVSEEDSFSFESDGGSAVKVTLCWTDKPGVVVNSDAEALDNPTIRLVNDLDLQVLAPDGTVYHPYVLDPANPDLPATTGVNIRDNVEQVYIPDPVPGEYTVTVSSSRMDVNTTQDYSLIISGQDQPLPGDFNADGVFNTADFAVMASYWLSSDSRTDIYPSFGDSVVDSDDLAWFVDLWLK